jgi:hypothetical protein
MSMEQSTLEKLNIPLLVKEFTATSVSLFSRNILATNCTVTINKIFYSINRVTLKIID